MSLTQWFQKPNLIKLILIGAFVLILNACGSSSSSSDPDSSMEVKLKVDPLTRLVTGEATVSGFTATAVHIHQGAVGADGPVLIGLVQDSVNANLFVTPDGARFTEDQYDDYIAGSTYFNSHSAANPTGEVREQIEAQTIDISNLVIDDTTGDASGYIMSGGFTATVAHIHIGFAGTSGGIRVPLEADATTAGRFNVPAGASVDVNEYSAGQLYVNVHSDDFPSGHIREQIEPSDIQVIGVEIDGDQVVPPVSDGGTATAYLTVNETTGALEVTMNLHNIDDATVAHIHDGLAGISGGFLQDAGTATFSESGGVWSITGVTLDAASLAKLLAGEAYINVHTTSDSNGEARGQIVPDGVSVVRVELTEAEAQAAGSITGSTSGGSATGYVTVNKNASPVTIEANITYSNVAATNAHVHTDNGGGIIVGLNPANGSGSGSDTLTAAELIEFEDDQFYFNLHTADNPGGELRGQIDD